MSEIDEIGIYKKALERWGANEEAIVWIEELSELQKEICKLLRMGVLENPHVYNLAAVTEEIVDVEIILAELKLALEIPETILKQIKRFKLERLRERLD